MYETAELPYSPAYGSEQNRIETLWHRLKHAWLELGRPYDKPWRMPSDNTAKNTRLILLNPLDSTLTQI